MGLFGGRGKGRDNQAARQTARQAEAIARFWAWWADEGMARSSSALAEGDPGRIVADMTGQVEAVAGELSWEFAKGDESMHKLVVTADGDPALRSTARRWLEGAPESDVFWSYADARPPMLDLSDSVLKLDSIELALNETRVGVRRSGTRVDVQVHHPRLEELGEQGRTTFCFLAVDAAVGETMTETWIGELHPSLVPPMDGFGLSGLRAVVRDMAQEFEGANSWVALEGVSQIGPVRVLARVPLAAASAPTLDQSVTISVTYTGDAEGLPDETVQRDLMAFRDHLSERLEGQGELVAIVMAGSRCQYHFYVDSTRTGAAQLEAAASGRPGRVETHIEDDPGWANVAHLRG